MRARARAVRRDRAHVGAQRRALRRRLPARAGVDAAASCAGLRASGVSDRCAASTASSSSTARRADADAAARWAGVTRHRGPDDEGMHVDGPLRDRHAPAVDHRPRRRPPAARPTTTARCGSSATARSTTSASCARELAGAGPSLQDRLRQRGRAAPLREYGDDFVDAPQRHVRVRAVGRAAPAAADRPRPPRHQAALRAAGRAAGSPSRARRRRCSPLPGVDAELDPRRARRYLHARLRAGAAVDLPRHPQAAAGDAAGRSKAAR